DHLVEDRAFGIEAALFDASAPQDRFDLVDADGMAQVIPLSQAAPELAQLRHLWRRFDALGDQAEPQCRAQPDDGAHEVAVGMLGGQVVDEGLGDLEHVDRQPPQIAERRISRAEVVDTALAVAAARCTRCAARSLRAAGSARSLRPWARTHWGRPAPAPDGASARAPPCRRAPRWPGRRWAGSARRTGR